MTPPENDAGLSQVFGAPGYKVRYQESISNLMLLRPDGTTVCMFEPATPEGAIKRVAMQDRKVWNLFRERVGHLLIEDLEQYVNYSAALEGELAVLRRLVQGGAVAEEFGPSGARGGARRRGIG